jgi:hypothetical protein
MPLQLSYRLGFYCNEVQDIGIELNFDPSNYTVLMAIKAWCAKSTLMKMNPAKLMP